MLGQTSSRFKYQIFVFGLRAVDGKFQVTETAKLII